MGACPSDIIQPGHIFPLMAKAGCDLTRLAGLEPAAVIVEILNDDGTMVRRPELEKFVNKHNIKIGTIADLIEYRIQNEQTVERKAIGTIPTEFGEFDLVLYEDIVNNNQHFALIRGDVTSKTPSLVRVHVQDTIRDLTENLKDDYDWTIRTALKRISEEEQGIIVVLQNQIDSLDNIEQVNNCGTNVKDNNIVNIHNRSELRTIGLGAQIIKDLGVSKMRVLGSPIKMPALSGFGLEVVEYIKNNDSKYFRRISNNQLIEFPIQS